MSRWSKGGKRVTSVLMAGLLTIAMMPQLTYASTQQSDTVDLTGSQPTLEKARESFEQSLQGTESTENTISPEKDVTVVVSVNAKAVLDHYVNSNAEDEITDYLLQNTELATTTEQKVEKVAKAATTMVTKDQEESKILFCYSTVFTGFSMTLPYKEISRVKTISGVSSVKIANEYEVPDTEEVTSDDLNMVTSREMIGTDQVQGQEGLNYTGQGMVVAILDTGIDYQHEAFQTALTTDQEDIVKTDDMRIMLNTLNLDAEKDFADHCTQGSTKLVANMDNQDTLNIYHSEKVPYGYDYTDHDVDCIPVTTQEHGTHVAGTVAGNCEAFQGVAPDAQIMSMKVFNDDGRTTDAILLAALDDAVMLGADVINMSLGSAAGTTYEENEYLQDAYDTIEKAGVNLDCSAGNNATGSSKNNYSDLQNTLNPDNGVVGSPSTLNAPMSVASVENTYLNYCSYITTDTGEKISYLDNGPSDRQLSTIEADKYTVVNCGAGTQKEMGAIDVNGKIALIQRGEITFTEKVQNAASGGAIAAVIYNNQSGTISMAITDYLIPAVSITKADGELILDSIGVGEDTIELNGTKTTAFKNPEAMEISSFSSWGPTPELTMKPEITTPGGNIYSAYYTTSDGTSVSGLMSGTSMAAPHMSGATALVKEYVKETYQELSPRATENLVNALLMSTADPIAQKEDVSDEEGENQSPVYYSVRQQGAGLVDLKEAITTPAYLTVSGSQRPKAELGDNQTGTFTISFDVNNLSDEEVTYPLSMEVETEGYLTEGENHYMSQRELDITSGCAVTYSGSNVAENQVTVAPKGDTTVVATITLNQDTDLMEELNSVYENGFYVEGFVLLGNGQEVDLSLPFLGFYGDWGKAAIFDQSFYDTDASPEYGKGNLLCSYFESEGKGYNLKLGNNLFQEIMTEDGGTYDKDHIAVSTNSIGNYTSILTSKTYALRGCQNFLYQITNDQGEIVDEEAVNYMPKSYYYTNGNEQTYCEDLYYLPTFNGLDENNQPLKEGKYHISISAEPMGVTDPDQYQNALAYDFVLDNTAPTVDEKDTKFYQDSNGNYCLKLTLSDNDYLAGTEVTAYRQKSDEWDDIAVKFYNHLDSEKVGNNWVLNYILGSPEAFKAEGLSTDKLEVWAYDYALNETKIEIPLTTASNGGGSGIVIIGGGSTAATPPADITECQGENTKHGVISLHWTESENAEGYEIYRMNSQGEFVKIGEVEEGVNCFLDTDIETGQLYQYLIKPYRTVNGERVYGNSASLSDVGSFIPGKASITSLKNQVKKGKNQITIRMKKVQGATGYIIYRCNKKDGQYAKIATIGKNQLTYKNTIPMNQKSCYYYKIQAIVKQSGKIYKGQMSPIVKVKVKTR